jgi:hypothetical protein
MARDLISAIIMCRSDLDRLCLNGKQCKRNFFKLVLIDVLLQGSSLEQTNPLQKKGVGQIGHDLVNLTSHCSRMHPTNRTISKIESY